MDEHVDRVRPRSREIKTEQGGEQCGAFGHVGGALVDDFDLIALEHCDIDVLARFFTALVFDDEESGAATSSTKQIVGMARVVPQTLSSPSCRHTPR